VARTVQLPCRMGPCDAGTSEPYANLAVGLNVFGVLAILLVFVLCVIALIRLARSWDAKASPTR